TEAQDPKSVPKPADEKIPEKQLPELEPSRDTSEDRDRSSTPQSNRKRKSVCSRPATRQARNRKANGRRVRRTEKPAARRAGRTSCLERWLQIPAPTQPVPACRTADLRDRQARGVPACRSIESPSLSPDCYGLATLAWTYPRHRRSREIRPAIDHEPEFVWR